MSDVVDELKEALENIPDADPDSLAIYDDDVDTGHFMIYSDADDQDVDQIDDELEAAGYERDGHIPVPEMVQQNIRPIEDEEAADE